MILSPSVSRPQPPLSPDPLQKSRFFPLPRRGSSLARRVFRRSFRFGQIVLPGLALGLLPGCAGFIQSSGPSAGSVRNAHPDVTGIQIVELTDSVASRLLARKQPDSFSSEFRDDGGPKSTVEPGDVLEVMIMEAPPASLFGSASATGNPSGAQAITFPDQYISSSGIIYIPFAGEIQAAGKTIQQIEDEITDRMKAKANQPQVLVRLINNNTNFVTVLGVGGAAAHLPLTAARERLLDALTKVGGSGGEVRTYSVRVTRGARSVVVPLDTIVRDPSQNIVMQPGDVVTVMHTPFSFTAMGATGNNQEVRFEGPYITLAQALARSGGLSSSQANIRGVFVFRFEAPGAVDWPSRPVVTTPGGKVRVIYCLDLSKPEGFFAAKSFPVCDGDFVYAAHAPGVGLKNMLSLVGSITSPTLSGAYDAAATANTGGF